MQGTLGPPACFSHHNLPTIRCRGFLMICFCSKLRLIVCAGVVWGSIWAAGRAENWPQWRGAKLDGISGEKGIPRQWNKAENVAWRMPLPGPAGATPVVWGDRIFLTSVAGESKEDLALMCIGTDGKLLWQ